VILVVVVRTFDISVTTVHCTTTVGLVVKPNEPPH